MLLRSPKILMNAQTLLHRQINPNWIQGGRITSQAFRPTDKDKGLLSVYDGAKITAENSWTHFTLVRGHRSEGVYSLSVADCSDVGLEAREDPSEFPEHAVIDFTVCASKGQVKTKADLLASKARTKEWSFRPTK